MLLGLGWVIYLISNSLGTLEEFWPGSWGALFMASVLVAVGMAMNGVLFYLFLAADRKQPLVVGFSRVMALHFSGQLLRYLPGRFWGVVYQAAVMHGEISKIRLARANIDLMIFSIGGSAVVGAGVVMARLDFPHWITVAMAIGGVGMLGALFIGGGRLVLRRTGRFIPQRLKGVLHEIAESDVSARTLLMAACIFLASWIAYLWGWHLLSSVYPAHSQVDFIALGALYSIASIIGILAAITPAGLGVREASFVMLSSGVAPPEVIAYFALFGRVWLLLIELVLCVLPLFFLVKRRVK